MSGARAVLSGFVGCFRPGMSGGVLGLCFWGPFAVLSSFCGLHWAGHIGDSLAYLLGPFAVLSVALWAQLRWACRGLIGQFFGPRRRSIWFVGSFGPGTSGSHWPVFWALCRFIWLCRFFWAGYVGDSLGCVISSLITALSGFVASFAALS